MSKDKTTITSHYDNLADILYIDFGCDEPCYTEDIDGFLMLEIGWLTNIMTGIRLFGIKNLINSNLVG